MITAVHTLIYSDDPDATRAFFRDVLGWPYAQDAPGWLIFKTGPSELGVHPTAGEHEGQTYSSPRHHLVSLMCDDIEQTVADLTAKGAKFDGSIVDRGYGRAIEVLVPGADPIQIYQPQHATAYDI